MNAAGVDDQIPIPIHPHATAPNFPGYDGSVVEGLIVVALDIDAAAVAPKGRKRPAIDSHAIVTDDRETVVPILGDGDRAVGSHRDRIIIVDPIAAVLGRSVIVDYIILGVDEGRRRGRQPKRGAGRQQAGCQARLFGGCGRLA